MIDAMFQVHTSVTSDPCRHQENIWTADTAVIPRSVPVLLG